MKGKTREHKARGGAAEPKAYNADGSNVEREAEERKHGGRVKKKHVGHVDGVKPRKHRLDRPGRKRGGSVGADMHPLSSAAKVRNAEGHDADTGDATEGD